jgi:hypothetical protein
MTSGIIALANAIRNMGAMTSLHVGMNHIPEKEMTEIIVLVMGKESMKLLCEVPIKDKSLTELDVSSKSLGTEGALVVAEYLRDNGALLVLSMNSNHLGVDGGKALAEGLKGNNAITELNIADNDLTYYGEDISGIIILADVIKDMGAMTSLNLASNWLYAEGAKIVAEAIKVTKCTPAIIFIPFSYPSDFSINCCCFLLSAGYGGNVEFYLWCRVFPCGHYDHHNDGDGLQRERAWCIRGHSDLSLPPQVHVSAL